MPGRYYQKLSATGSANSTVLDGGLESTQAETKRIIAVHLHVTGWVGNDVEIWLEQERLAQIPDYLVLTDDQEADSNVKQNTNRMLRWEVDRELPVGMKLQAGIKCGATAKNLTGVYEYEKI